MAESALNLRLVLAAGGAVLCLALGVLALVLGFTVLGVVLLVLAATAVVDAGDGVDVTDGSHLPVHLPDQHP